MGRGPRLRGGTSCVGTDRGMGHRPMVTSGRVTGPTASETLRNRAPSWQEARATTPPHGSPKVWHGRTQTRAGPCMRPQGASTC